MQLKKKTTFDQSAFRDLDYNMLNRNGEQVTHTIASQSQLPSLNKSQFRVYIAHDAGVLTICSRHVSCIPPSHSSLFR